MAAVIRRQPERKTMNIENICRSCNENSCPVKKQIKGMDAEHMKKLAASLKNPQECEPKKESRQEGETEARQDKKSMMDINKIILLNYLKDRHTGEENAVFSRELEYMLDMSGRDIRRVISALRKDGAPICSDYHKGYYYAEKQSELERTLKGLGEHIDGMNDTIAMLAKAKAQMIPKIKSIRIVITPAEGPEQEMMVLLP